MAGTACPDLSGAQSERDVDSLSRLKRKNRQQEVLILSMGFEWILSGLSADQ